MSGLLKPAIEGHSGAARWAQISRFRITRRRVYVRNPDDSPVRDLVSVDIGSTDVTFSWEHTMRVDGIAPLLPAPNDPALAAS